MPPLLKKYFLPQIPNTLTSTRIVAALIIGYFAALEYVHFGPQAASDIFHWNRVTALILYLVFACATDALDGTVARKYGWVSTTGEWLDPLADKAIAIAVLGYAWVMFQDSMQATMYYAVFLPTVIFVAAYGCVTTVLRIYGVVGAASKTAQRKTLVQMVAMGFFIVAGSLEHVAPTASAVLLYAGIPILVYSAWLCIPSLRGYLRPSMQPAE
jgi:CDP-diacylglycerol---glycerol-3-phosphate 3-phosphatidyltransferase